MKISTVRFANLALSLAIFLIAMLLYTTTASPGLIIGQTGVESETAQLQRVANRLGIAHSTGYPLHTIIGYFAARLADVFDASPYTWITYTSSIATGIALVMLFHLLKRIGNAPSALGGTLLFMVTDNVWHMSTITETQALHAITVIGVFLAIHIHLENPKKLYPLVMMAVLVGIGLANHRTSAFSFGAAGLAVLLTGVWLKWNRRQWAIILLAFIIPILSHGYIFWRVQDPNVAFSIRPTWFPSELDNQDMVDLIRGTLQSGEGLEGNMQVPTEDFDERFSFVETNLNDELSSATVILGLIGLGILAFSNWRYVLVLAVYSLVWVAFLMSWRLDWKSIIYFHSITVVVIMGLVTLTAFMQQRVYEWIMEKISKGGVRQDLYQIASALKHPVMMAIFALPLFYMSINTYQANYEVRDLSSDTLGTEYYKEMDLLPASSNVFTGGWTADTFILLEYLDENDRQDIMPTGNFNAGLPVQMANDTSKTVIISPALRGYFGLYSGSSFFKDQSLSFSGTRAPSFFQLRPPNDPRLAIEANKAVVIQENFTPEIDLYSYEIQQVDDYFEVIIYWQALENMETPYSVFTHLRDYGEACNIDTLRSLIAQDDSFGTVRNMHPTNWWQAEEIVKDTYFIPKTLEQLPEGASIVIGMTRFGEPMSEICIPVTEIVN